MADSRRLPRALSASAGGSVSESTAADSALDVFLVVHDQELLLECEASRTLRHLPRYRWLLVGDRPADRVAERADVVVARELPHQIEDRANLVAFTAWYAVQRNGLAEAPYVALLEYDSEPGADFGRAVVEALEASPDALIGFLPVPLTDPRFATTNVPLRDALRGAHGVDVDELIARHLEQTGSDLWTATSNVALARSTLDEFVDWYLPVADALGADPLGAHVHERALAVFGIATGRRITCVPGRLRHRQARSHGVGIELESRVPPGTRRLPPRPSDPELSVVVATRGGGERVIESLRSLAPVRQQGVDDDAYEVVVIDDGSFPPLDRETILGIAPNFRHFHRGSPVPDPSRAVDFGVEMARADALALVVDPLEPASPSFLRQSQRDLVRSVGSPREASLTGRPDSPLAGRALLTARRCLIELGGHAGYLPKEGAGRRASAGDRISARIERLTEERRRLQASLVRARSELSATGHRVRRLEHRIERQAGQLAAHSDRLRQVLASRSWRMTAPFRRFMERIRGRR